MKVWRKKEMFYLDWDCERIKWVGKVHPFLSLRVNCTELTKEWRKKCSTTSVPQSDLDWDRETIKVMFTHVCSTGWTNPMFILQDEPPMFVLQGESPMFVLQGESPTFVLQGESPMFVLQGELNWRHRPRLWGWSKKTNVHPDLSYRVI